MVICLVNAVCISDSYSLVGKDVQHFSALRVGVVLAVHQRFAAVCRADAELFSMYELYERTIIVFVYCGRVANLYSVVLCCDVCVDLCLAAVTVGVVNSIDHDVFAVRVVYLKQIYGCGAVCKGGCDRFAVFTDIVTSLNSATDGRCRRIAVKRIAIR